MRGWRQGINLSNILALGATAVCSNVIAETFFLSIYLGSCFWFCIFLFVFQIPFAQKRDKCTFLKFSCSCWKMVSVALLVMWHKCAVQKPPWWWRGTANTINVGSDRWKSTLCRVEWGYRNKIFLSSRQKNILVHSPQVQITRQLIDSGADVNAKLPADASGVLWMKVGIGWLNNIEDDFKR